MPSPVHYLYPDEQALEGSGEDFKLTSYVRDLTRCGVARTLEPALATLMHLAGRANKQRECWPMEDEIAESLGCYRRRIVDDVTLLRERGAVAVVRRYLPEGKRGKWQNGYVILPVSNIVAHTPPGLVKSDRVRKSAHGQGRPRAEKRTRACAEKRTQETACPFIEGIQMEGTNKSAASAPPESTTYNASPPKRTRATVCRDADEERDREAFLALFDARLHPITVGSMQGRYRNEALRALRLHGLQTLSACLHAMATSKRFVLKDWVSPVTVSNNVLTWQEAGAPPTWDAVDRYAAGKVRRQGGR